MLVSGQPLDERHRDHAPGGTYRGTRDCHVGPDWVLIYELTDDELVLIRTGTHADLFE